VKVKEITKQQYLDFAELGMPIWSFERSDESNLLHALQDIEAQYFERILAVKYSSRYENFVTLVEDDSDES